MGEHERERSNREGRGRGYCIQVQLLMYSCTMYYEIVICVQSLYHPWIFDHQTVTFLHKLDIQFDLVQKDGLLSTHTFTKSYFSQLVLFKKINIELVPN